jgi:hypothetical protein
MSARHYTFRTSGNPLVQALWVVVGVAVLVAAVVMGALVLAVLLVLGVVAAAVFAIRVWWLKRKLERAGTFAAGPEHSTSEGSAASSAPRLIEAEYTVVSERDADEAHAPHDSQREAREPAHRRTSR